MAFIKKYQGYNFLRTYYYVCGLFWQDLSFFLYPHLFESLLCFDSVLPIYFLKIQFMAIKLPLLVWKLAFLV